MQTVSNAQINNTRLFLANMICDSREEFGFSIPP